MPRYIETVQPTRSVPLALISQHPSISMCNFDAVIMAHISCYIPMIFMVLLTSSGRPSLICGSCSLDLLAHEFLLYFIEVGMGLDREEGGRSGG